MSAASCVCCVRAYRNPNETTEHGDKVSGFALPVALIVASYVPSAPYARVAATTKHLPNLTAEKAAPERRHGRQ